jgi:uncharacterized protein YggE
MNEEIRHTLVAASRPVRIAATVALGMLALFLLVKTFDAYARIGEGDTPQVNTITVTGTGTSSATPNIAKISFTVQESAADVKTAQTAATKKTNDALAALKALGVADKDVKTTAYTVSPQYATDVPSCGVGIICPRPMIAVNSNTVTGYQVSQSVEVTVRDTNKASDVVSKLGGLGVQNISGPDFTVDDDSGVLNDARAAAIKNAQDKAKELAKELGVSLEGVVSYSDQGNVTYPMYDKAMSVGASAPAPELPVGTDDRTVNVQVTYRIK